MNWNLIALVAGIAAGYFLHDKIKFYDKIYPIIISLLFFFIGINVGRNNVVLGEIGLIGLRSLILALTGIFGSIVFVKLIEKWKR
jgi:uncharacterized membrane protein YbjE (DUF340 family)